MQVDHLKPIVRTRVYIGNNKYKSTGCLFPQDDTLENKMPSCRLCNYHKHTYNLEEFRNEVEKKVDRIMNSNMRLLLQYGLIAIKPERTVIFYFEKCAENNSPPMDKENLVHLNVDNGI